MRQEKQKRGEERKRKVEVKTAVSNPKFLLSTHARTSQANILHLDQMQNDQNEDDREVYDL